MDAGDVAWQLFQMAGFLRSAADDKAREIAAAADEVTIVSSSTDRALFSSDTLALDLRHDRRLRDHLLHGCYGRTRTGDMDRRQCRAVIVGGLCRGLPDCLLLLRFG